MRIVFSSVAALLVLVSCKSGHQEEHIEPLCPIGGGGSGGACGTGGGGCDTGGNTKCERPGVPERKLAALDERMLEPEILFRGKVGSIELVNAPDGSFDGFVITRCCGRPQAPTEYMQRDRDGSWKVTASADWLDAGSAAAGKFIASGGELVAFGETEKHQLVLGRPADLADPDRFHVARLPGRPITVHAADVDGDGHDDVVAVVTIPQERGWDHSVLVTLLGMGDGTLAEAATLPLGTEGFWWVSLGDINGDGLLDAVATNAVRSPDVDILLGVGAGRFERSRTVSLTTPSGPGGAVLTAWSTALLDLNGDGHLDLVVGGGSTSVGMVYFEGDGTGAFGSPLEVAVPSYGSFFVRDEDERTQFTTRSLESDRIVVVDTPLSATPNLVEFHPGFSSVDGMTADFDGDGVSDMLVAKYNGLGDVGYLRGRGRYFDGLRTFRRPGEVARGVVLEDTVDGVTVALTATAMDAILIGRLSENGFEVSEEIRDVTDPFAIAVIDLNRDGRRDLVVGSSGPDVTAFLRRDDGSFERTHLLAADAWDFVVGDFDGDGIDDLAIALADSFELAFVYSRSGSGPWPVARMAIAGDPAWLAKYDFDDDGDEDLIVALFRAGRLVRLENRGEDGFGEPEIVATLSTPQGLVVCDMDGDGADEIVVGSFDGRSIQVVSADGSITEFAVDGRVTAIGQVAAERGCGVVAIDTHNAFHSLAWNDEAHGPRLQSWPHVLGYQRGPASQIITSSRSIISLFPAWSRIGYIPATPTE